MMSNADSKIIYDNNCKRLNDKIKNLEEKELEINEYHDLFSNLNTEDLIKISFSIKTKHKSDKIITYSRKVFINVINLCKDICSYCTYRKEPNDIEKSLLSPQQILSIAENGRKLKCTEALFVTGERPEAKYDEVRIWLKKYGHASTAEYIRDVSEQVLKKTGLLPHSNIGNMTKKEMNLLRETNVSLGLMLETVSQRLLGVGMAHENAPSKHPNLRIKTIEYAGQLNIPITTGLLIGIGETLDEIIESLLTIKKLNQKYGHIQEVIIQNFTPKINTKMAHYIPPTHKYFLKVVALSRIILPDMNIQVPPNLTPNIYEHYIDAGINDWGGISPVTIDHVNPEFTWPKISEIERSTNRRGFVLRARLPIYPEFICKKFLSNEMDQYVMKFIDNEGLVKQEYLG